MVDMLEYVKTTLISRMNKNAAIKTSLEELVTIPQAEKMKSRMEIEENTIALVKSLVGDIFYRVKSKSQYEYGLASINSSYDSKMATQKDDFDFYMASELVNVTAQYDAKLASELATASDAFNERLHAQLAIASNQYEEKVCIAHNILEGKLTTWINVYNESECKSKEYMVMYTKLLDANKRRDQDGNAAFPQVPPIYPGLEDDVDEESDPPWNHDVAPIASNPDRCEDVDRGHTRHISSSNTPRYKQ
jgi:hypothetical protein